MSSPTLLALLLVAGCSGDIGKDKVNAVEEGKSVSVEKAAEAPEADAASSVTWSVDTAQSKISALSAKRTATT